MGESSKTKLSTNKQLYLSLKQNSEKNKTRKKAKLGLCWVLLHASY